MVLASIGYTDKEPEQIDFIEIAKRTKVEVATAKTGFTKARKKLWKNLQEDAADAEPELEALERAPESDPE